jgi:hypothetical protein
MLFETQAIFDSTYHVAPRQFERERNFASPDSGQLSLSSGNLPTYRRSYLTFFRSARTMTRIPYVLNFLAPD